MSDELPDDVLKAVNRAWQMTMIKDDPKDDLYDTLRLIGKELHTVLVKYHPGIREAHLKSEAEKAARRERDEQERRELWEELERNILSMPTAPFDPPPATRSHTSEDAP